MEPPKGWGRDELTAFEEAAYQNCWATYVRKKGAHQKLVEIDACFLRVSKDWLNPENMLTPLFFFRSHSAFRAACQLAMAGQVTDAFPLLRVCLEYSAYALHIHKNPSLSEIWLNRHNGKTAKKLVRDNFTIAKIRETVRQSNIHMGAIFADLYERCIDFGGHPNERSMTGSMKVIEAEGEKRYLQFYLHGDGLALDHILRTTAQVGVCALEILQDAFKGRFEILGARLELLKIRQGL